MIIIGHSAIDAPNFVQITRIEDIMRTIPNDVVWFENDANFAISRHCKANGISYAFSAKNLHDVLIAANLGATYIIVNENLAKNAQQIANEYFFDSKILCIINDEVSMENMALLGVDGVIFGEVLKK